MKNLKIDLNVSQRAFHFPNPIWLVSSVRSQMVHVSSENRQNWLWPNWPYSRSSPLDKPGTRYFSPKGRGGSNGARLLCFSLDELKLTGKKYKKRKYRKKTLPAHTLAVSRGTSTGTHWNLIMIMNLYSAKTIEKYSKALYIKLKLKINK